jgi:hypothetical protein
MSFMKLSSIFLLAVLFIGAFIPEASARRHCRSRSSFGLSFNLGGPGYVVAPAPAPAVIAPAPVYPGRAYVAPPPVYPYPYYYAPPVMVERPGVYVQPGFSYSYWRY